MNKNFCALAGSMLFGIFFLIMAYSAAEEKSVTAGMAIPITPQQMPKADHLEDIKPVPAPAHVLDAFIGRWNFTARIWISPQSSPIEMKGVSSSKWILGGKFLQQDIFGKALGKNFEGIGLTVYDGLKEEFQTAWADNMGTGLVKSTGHFNSATRALVEKGRYSSALTGEKEKDFRSEWKLIDGNTYSYEMYSKAPDGAEFKTVAILYERRNED